MGYSVGYDNRWKRDIGYGVPAVCDQPGCDAKIDRGLSYVCGGDIKGGEYGCGLYFCLQHLYDKKVSHTQYRPVCKCCKIRAEPFDAKPDTREWIEHKLTDASWKGWRDSHARQVEALRKALKESDGTAAS